MKKLLFYLMALPFACFFTACGDNDESSNGGVTVTLTSQNLTDDGYFDGIMYYKITSNSPQEVTVTKVEQNAVTVEIPSIVKIDGSNYKCTSISERAFYGCRNLIKVNIPNGVTSIDAQAFSGCSGLIEISIPNGVISIGESAFYGCRNLTKVNIPNGVTSIGAKAFLGCSGLIEISIPNGVISIGEGAFYQCSGLTKISIPNSVISIGEGAFSGCNGLTEMTIGSNVSRIGNTAFYNESLISIHCKATIPPTIYYYPFSPTVYSNATLYVPKGTLDAYKSSYGWKQFKNIVEE